MEKYFTYEIEDFLEDFVFIQWIKSGYVLNDNLFVELKNHSPLLKQKIEKASELLSTIIKENEYTLSDTKKQALLEKIKSNLSVEEGKEKGSIVRFIPWLAAASILLFFIVNTFVLSNEEVSPFSIDTQYEPKGITLPDSSKIYADIQTNVHYGKDFNVKRIVHLKGRAHFDVERGSKFTVLTDKGSVEVLGTSFTVDTRGSFFNVYCKEGKVAVKAKNQEQEKVITAMQAIKLEEGRLVALALENENDILWKEGRFYFQDERLSEVIKELQNQYQIKIQTTTSIGNLKYTGYFYRDKLDESLKAITWPLRLNYKKDSLNVYTIY